MIPEQWQLFHCRKCGWCSEAKAAEWAMHPICECGARLKYLRFTRDETPEAEATIGQKVRFANEEAEQ